MTQAERKAKRAGLAVLTIYGKYDAQVKAAVAAKNVSCRAGCSHCCRLPASASVAEMVPIVRALAEHPDWAEKLKPEIEKLVGQQMLAIGTMNMMDADDRSTYMRKEVACMFLGDDEHCKVYDLRPSACRYHYVVTPAENCSPLLPDAHVGRVDLRKLENLVALTSAQEIGELLAGPIPAAFVMAARMLNVEFYADDVAVKRAMFPRVKVPPP